ncbi:hypothetical protein [Streptomyces wuyuanensis]|uniref:hypothetical protein n=1 Tax=Streptomyces wuyuanensis TaxID=1196353 RepID=UPI00341403B1
MLVLGNRNFASTRLVRAWTATGAEVCLRGKANRRLPVDRMLPDGSWLSRIQADADKKNGLGRVIVRVIRYRLDDPGRPEVRL